MDRRIVVLLVGAMFAAAAVGGAVAGIISDPRGAKALWTQLTAEAFSEPEAVSGSEVQNVEVNRNDDRRKTSTQHGVLLQGVFEQEPWSSGPSPQAIHLSFDAPVEILGLAISVDIGGAMTLVEFSAGIGARQYGNDQGVDWLLHTSYSEDPYRFDHGHTDEQVWFGPDQGFAMDADDHLGVTAWLQNASHGYNAVSPEVVVWYRWLD